MKYRKKPVVIEAFQMTEKRREDNSDWPKWMNRAWSMERNEVGALFPACPGSKTNRLLAIRRPMGDIIIEWNDYIIQGTDGELYSCNPDIFEKTYEKIFERTNGEERDDR